MKEEEKKSITKEEKQSILDAIKQMRPDLEDKGVLKIYDSLDDKEKQKEKVLQAVKDATELNNTPNSTSFTVSDCLDPGIIDIIQPTTKNVEQQQKAKDTKQEEIALEMLYNNNNDYNTTKEQINESIKASENVLKTLSSSAHSRKNLATQTIENSKIQLEFLEKHEKAQQPSIETGKKQNGKLNPELLKTMENALKTKQPPKPEPEQPKPEPEQPKPEPTVKKTSKIKQILNNFRKSMSMKKEEQNAEKPSNNRISNVLSNLKKRISNRLSKGF